MDRHIVLVGPAGAGKTTVGRALAQRVGASFVDLDGLVEHEAGCTISELFEAQGETAFRNLEARVLAVALASATPAVVATGGGVVLRSENRRLLSISSASTVWLSADVRELAGRVGAGTGRPLIEGEDIELELSRLVDARADGYAEVANHRIDTTATPVNDVVDAILAATGVPVASGPVAVDHLRHVNVDLGDRSYPVLIGAGAREQLTAVLPEGTTRVAVITQSSVPWVVDPGVDHELYTIPDGEAAKTLAVVERLCSDLAASGFTRRDVIVAVGGGVVTDVAGFVASVYHRGVRFVSVPTTLLAQIDAAIGGKTGVNLAEGKNLVGTYWQPEAVLCDTEVLSTLPAPELRSGYGELAKYHFLGGGDLDTLDDTARVAECVQIKADVVASDEREDGRRAVLNYGHTLAHAIETAGHYGLRHGEAVGIGIRYAAEVARRMNRIDDDRVTEHRRVLAAYDLPSILPPGLDDAVLLELFRRDKKALDGLTLVLDGPDGVEPVSGVDRSVLQSALEAMRS